MISMLSVISHAFEQAIRNSFPDLENVPVAVTPSTQEKFGDYQCNSAMTISQVSSKVISIFVNFCLLCDSFDKGISFLAVEIFLLWETLFIMK